MGGKLEKKDQTTIELVEQVKERERERESVCVCVCVREGVCV
jgi:hypothetical protein